MCKGGHPTIININRDIMKAKLHKIKFKGKVYESYNLVALKDLIMGMKRIHSYNK